MSDTQKSRTCISDINIKSHLKNCTVELVLAFSHETNCNLDCNVAKNKF